MTLRARPDRRVAAIPPVLYASRHPEQVVGMLVVDGVHPGRPGPTGDLMADLITTALSPQIAQTL